MATLLLLSVIQHFHLNNMTSIRWRARILQLGLACTALSVQAADVQVSISLTTPGGLDVSYRVPANCLRLPFLRNGDGYARIRATWKASDDCGSANGDALTVNQAQCASVRFRVPASFDKVTGYPGAFPIGAGLFVHTSKYAVDNSCGTVSYTFQAPGSIGIDGKLEHASAGANAVQGADLALLFLPIDVPARAGTPSYFDPQLTPAAVRQIQQVADDTIALYRKALPDAPFKMPIMAAAKATEPGSANVGGDGGDVMRLSFFNWPDQPGRAEQQKMTLLVSHEMSHRFQLRDAVDVYPDARLIHEGGAEFLRWMAALHYGWMSHAEAAQDLDNALGDCLIDAGQHHWRSFSERTIGMTRMDYRCGLPAYVYALAARQGQGLAFERFNAFYRQLKSGQTPDFAATLECGDAPACTARWLPRLLGTAAMRSEWERLFADTGLARPVAANQAQSDAMMLRALTELVRADCKGNSSITPMKGAVLIDAMPGCATLHRDLAVTQVQALALFGDARALPALNAACSARQAIELGLSDGSTVTLPCAQAYQGPAHFYAVDLERLLRNLNRH